MLVSGGHSSLLRIGDVTSSVEPMGMTIDDAAGEAFDKVARLLGLPFPGGPHIDRAARSGSSVAIDFPRGRLGLSRDPEKGPAGVTDDGFAEDIRKLLQARRFQIAFEAIIKAIKPMRETAGGALWQARGQAAPAIKGFPHKSLLRSLLGRLVEQAQDTDDVESFGERQGRLAALESRHGGYADARQCGVLALRQLLGLASP
jgi:hypothetical protein